MSFAGSLEPVLSFEGEQTLRTSLVLAVVSWACFFFFFLKEQELVPMIFLVCIKLCVFLV